MFYLELQAAITDPPEAGKTLRGESVSQDEFEELSAAGASDSVVARHAKRWIVRRTWSNIDHGAYRFYVDLDEVCDGRLPV